MKKISKEEFDNALVIVERFKYQENPTKTVSVTYDAKVNVCVNIPIDWSLEKIKDELEDGSYHGLDLEEPVGTRIQKMTELIVDGDEIDLNITTNVDIEIKEFVCDEDNSEIVKITYNGSGDPVINLDKAIKNYFGNSEYSDFIDANMDNPWVKLFIKK